MFDLENLTLEDLYSFKSFIQNTSVDDLNKKINDLIAKRKKENSVDFLNKKFTVEYMREWGVFTPKECEVLLGNGISNLHDLLNFDLESLSDASSEMKRKFEVGRKLYDLKKYAKCNKEEETKKRI
jgi:hypothetical protein